MLYVTRHMLPGMCYMLYVIYITWYLVYVMQGECPNFNVRRCMYHTRASSWYSYCTAVLVLYCRTRFVVS